jgi:hypothetical protein
MKFKPFLLSFALLIPPVAYLSFYGSTEVAQHRGPSAFGGLSHQQDTRIKNAKILRWADKKSSDLSDWLDRRGENGGPPEWLDWYIPEKMVKLNLTEDEAKVAAATKELYDTYFPPSDPSSYIGTFFESGHPYILTKRGPYQWNSLKAAGLEEPGMFKSAVSILSKQGIKSYRLGPNIHEVDLGQPETWKPFVDKLEIIWREGGTPTISVAFFPSLKKWEVTNEKGEVDYFKSYLLNPKWPTDMGKLAEEMMTEVWERAEKVEVDLGHKVNVVINGINEPETLAGFNRQFWHGATPNWSSPEKNRAYIPSVIHIGEANVQIRRAVEKTAKGRRVLFMHNEAMTPDYYPSHVGGGRYAVSKFMLGDDIVINGDFEALLNEDLGNLKSRLFKKEKRNEVEWALKEYVFSNWNKSDRDQESARADLIQKFQRLKNAHAALKAETGKTMKTDNMLHLDYYYQTEFVPNKDIEELTTELAANNGEKLKEVLDVDSDEAFLKMLQYAGTNSDGDLPPEGPKGAKIDLSAFKSVKEIDLGKMLRIKDRVLLERLIGLRRDYHMSDEDPYKDRQLKIGLRPLESQLYRTDHFLDKVSANNGELLKKSIGVASDDLVDIIKKAAKKTRTEINEEDLKVFKRIEINMAEANRKIRGILEANGHAIFNELFGLERQFKNGFEPQHYARQIRAGIRYGFYSLFLDYVKELKLYAAGVGESGTPFYVFAPLLHDQVMMEYALALKNGIYGTTYNFGPGVDTRGWAKGPLSFHYDDDHEVNPSGILMIKDGKLKFRGMEPDGKWMPQFVDPLFEALKED